MSVSSHHRTIVAVIVALLSMCGVAAAAPVWLAWDPNTEPDIAGYQVSYGTAAGVYSKTVDAGNNTILAVDGLTRGTTYYFVVRAVNSGGQLSAPSNEVAYTVPVFPVQDPVLYVPGTGSWSAAMTDAANPSSAPAVATGWTVRSGDFDNDGYADFLLYNPSTGDWYKALYDGRGSYTYSGGYHWSPGWSPYVADFNGDGASDVFLYNAVTGRWALALANGPGDFLYAQYGEWSPGWNITVSDLNADGRADMFLYNPAAPPDPNSGRWFRVFSRADTSFEYREGTARWSGGWQVYAADFDGNGWGDVFVYNAVSGRWFQVLFTGDAVEYREGLWSAGWEIHPADFDGDGRTDLFVYNTTSGRWFQVMSTPAAQFTYIEGLWSPGWAVTIADLNHDGRSDLFVYDATTGRNFQVTTIAPGVFDYLMSYAQPNATVVFAGSR